MAAVAVGFLMLPWAGMGSARRRLRQMPRLAAILAVLTLGLGAAINLAGCSSGGGNGASSSPPPQSYTLVVTATDATTGAKSSANLTLTVE